MDSPRLKKNIIELTRCSADEYRQMPKIGVSLMADNVRSMHNIGSLFRTADAFLFDELILAGISGCPPHPEITKTALGAEESVSWRHVEDGIEELRHLQDDGWTVCVLEQAHDSVPLSSFKVEKDKKYIIVVGNEVTGVDQRIVDLADHILEIPQHGVKHSLNVSISGGIAMHHFFSSKI